MSPHRMFSIPNPMPNATSVAPAHADGARRRHRRAALLLAAMLASAGASAQVVELYEQPQQRGTRLSLESGVSDLSPYGMAGRVSSLVIHRGEWELCTQAGHRGACLTLGPGRYDRLPPALDNNLVSLRQIAAVVPAPEPPRPGAGRAGAAIVLYTGDFEGTELRLSDAAPNLRPMNFNDNTASIDVLAGAWELCSDGGFSGQCRRYGLGRHVLPPELRGQLSSLRPLAAAVSPYPPNDRPYPPAPGNPGSFPRPWPGATAAIVFHEHPNFTGRQLPLVAATPNFAVIGYNDQASAIEVFRGRWQVCRHIDYGGDCAVYGPGRYALGAGLQDAVSSARPVADGGSQPIGRSGAVTLHDDPNLRGRGLFIDAEVRNLRELSFNDRALAIEVHGGQWELCSASDYRGRCLVVGPGWHRLPQGLAGELTSLRPVASR